MSSRWVTIPVGLDMNAPRISASSFDRPVPGPSPESTASRDLVPEYRATPTAPLNTPAEAPPGGATAKGRIM